MAAEFSIVKVRATQLTGQARNSARARLAQHLTHHLDAYLAACQVGITLSSLGLGWIGEPAIASIIEPPLIAAMGDVPPALAHGIAFAIAFAFISFLHIVLGELAPKSLAIQRAVGTSMWIAYPLHIFYKVMFPFIYVLNGVGNWVVSLVGLRPATEAEHAHSPDELRLLVDAAEEAGTINEAERELLSNAFVFGDRPVRQVMIPRTEVHSVPAETTGEDLFRLADESRFSRLPVRGDSLDDVIGVLHVRDLARSSSRRLDVTARDLARPLGVLPEMARLVDAVPQLVRSEHEMMLVSDEFGGTSGLLTLRDAVDELLGVHGAGSGIEEQADGALLVDGLASLHDLSDRLEQPLDSDGSDTVGGLVVARLGRLARPGDVVDLDGLRLEVLETARHRVVKVRIRR